MKRILSDLVAKVRSGSQSSSSSSSSPASASYTSSNPAASYLQIVSACHGAGYYSRSKEDRIIVIDDLQSFINEKIPSYDLNRYGEPPLPSTGIPSVWPLDSSSNDATHTTTTTTSESIFKLYAVFDGHCGAFASTFLQRRFPFSLATTPSFAKGQFETALKEAYAECHAALLASKKYSPEAPSNDFSSGATASVALVTPQNTYFAFLGDSPIIIWRADQDKPDTIFKEHDIENEKIHDTMVSSNIFFVGIRESGPSHTYTILTNDKTKRKVLKTNMVGDSFGKSKSRHKNQNHPDAAYKYDDVRVGMSALNVWGTLGDSIYDVDVFNCLLELIEEFKSTRKQRWETKKKELGCTDEPVAEEGHGESSGGKEESSSSSSPPSQAADTQSPTQQESSSASIDQPPPTALLASATETTPSSSVVTSPEVTTTTTTTTKRRKSKFSPPCAPSSSASSTSSSINENGSTCICTFSFERPNITLEELKAMDPRNDFTYNELREWVLTRPIWQTYLRKHISFLPREAQMSRVLLSAIRQLSYPEDKLVAPGLLRVPQTKCVPNSELRLFLIASDGVVRFYDKFKSDYDGVIVKYGLSQSSKCVEELKKFLEWIGDDRSVILGKFKKK